MSNGNKSLKKFFKSNNFIGSYKSVDSIPSFNNISECCFIGRSNVGKSSLINAITNNKKLAKTSKTPGRTQSINIFNISEGINLVDLPGYGYANVSKVLQNQLSDLVQNYFEFRSNLIHVFVLIDIKVGIKNSDIDMFDILNNFQKKFSIILTKIDKCPKSFIAEQNTSTLSLMKNYNNFFSNLFYSSAKTKHGIYDIQKNLYALSLDS